MRGFEEVQGFSSCPTLLEKVIVSLQCPSPTGDAVADAAELVHGPSCWLSPGGRLSSLNVQRSTSGLSSIWVISGSAWSSRRTSASKSRPTGEHGPQGKNKKEFTVAFLSTVCPGFACSNNLFGLPGSRTSLLNFPNEQCRIFKSGGGQRHSLARIANFHYNLKNTATSPQFVSNPCM